MVVVLVLQPDVQEGPVPGPQPRGYEGRVGKDLEQVLGVLQGAVVALDLE